MPYSLERRGLSEIYGALIAIMVAAGVASTLILVGGKVSWAIGEAGENARSAMIESGSPLLAEPKVSGGTLSVYFYSPGAPISKIMALSPGGSVVGEAVLGEPLVEGEVVVLEAYDCRPVVLAFITSSGVVKFGGGTVSCGQNPREGGASAQPSLYLPSGGSWVGVMQLSAPQLVSASGLSSVGSTLKVSIGVSNSCTVSFQAGWTASTVVVDGSQGYSEAFLGGLETQAGFMGVYAFSACMGDGLWAGVRISLEGLGPAVYIGSASVEGSVKLLSTIPRDAPHPIVYTDGLQGLSGGGTLSQSPGSPLRWYGSLSVSGGFSSQTGVIALLHAPEPQLSEALLEAAIAVDSVLPLQLVQSARVRLTIDPPVALQLAAYRDGSPLLGIDVVLHKPVQADIVVAAPDGSTFVRSLSSRQPVWISGPAALELVLRPPGSMGTLLKPSVTLKQASDSSYDVIVGSVASPASAPLKPMLIWAITPQSRVLIAVGLGSQPVLAVPAESLQAGPGETFYAMDIGWPGVSVSTVPANPTPQNTYLKIVNNSSGGLEPATIVRLD